MKKQETILAGQILQCRDKLFARRHNVPTDLRGDWQSLMREANKLEPQIDPTSHRKTLSFSGNAQSLRDLLSELKLLAQAVSH